MPYYAPYHVQQAICPYLLIADCGRHAGKCRREQANATGGGTCPSEEEREARWLVRKPSLVARHHVEREAWCW
jgi:hypothetical protein